MTIKEFKGISRFLSNFYPKGFWYGELYFPTNEHFYQAMKTLNQAHRLAISLAKTPGVTKRMASKQGYKGFKIVLREDWESIKEEVMLYGLRKKFKPGSKLAQKLIDTAPHNLEEGNWWGDMIWGICLKTGKGRNLLGKLLMKVRLELTYGGV